MRCAKLFNWSCCALFVLLLFAPSMAVAQQAAGTRTGAEVYNEVCATCHGPDGRGGVNLELEKIVAPPDFTEYDEAAAERHWREMVGLYEATLKAPGEQARA